MKKILVILLFQIFMVNAQITIVEGALGADHTLFKYAYSEVMNKVILCNSNQTRYNRATFNSLLIFDENGNHESIEIVDGFSSFELSDNKTDVIAVLDSDFGQRNVVYYADKLTYDFGKVNADYNFLFERFFTNSTQLRILNAKNKQPDLFKDELYLDKIDYKGRTNKNALMEKPNIDRLKGDDLVKVRNAGGYASIIDNNTFEIITKNISKDLRTSTLYRTIYNLDGKIIKDIKYSYTLDAGTLERCSLQKTVHALQTPRNNSFSTSVPYGQFGPPLDLSINTHIIDPINLDVYICGLYEENVPAGFYMVKFSKDGDLIWKKQFPVKDKKLNRKSQPWNTIRLSIDKYYDDAFAVSIGSHYGSENSNNFFLIDKVQGMILKQSAKEATTVAKGGFLTMSKTSIYQTIKMEKAKYCDVNTLMVYSLDPYIKNYIDAVTTKNEVSFVSYISSKGIWLIETDNKEYYKVSLFKNP